MAATICSAADPSIGIAPGGLAVVSGINPALMAPRLPVAGGPQGVALIVTDAKGVRRTAAMTDVWSSGIQFEVPADTAPGPAVVEIVNPAGDASANVAVQRLAPALFVLKWVEVDGARSNAVRIAIQ